MASSAGPAESTKLWSWVERRRPARRAVGVEPVWIALEHRVEEGQHRSVRRKQFVHDTEIIAGVGDGAEGVVVEILVLVPGDDPAGGRASPVSIALRHAFRPPLADSSEVTGTA